MRYSYLTKTRKIQNLLPILRHEISSVRIRFSLNNFYIHVMTSNGNTLFSVSGGTIKVPSSKRNSNYNFELLLSRLIQKLVAIRRMYVILYLDITVLKRKKLILKLFQKYSLNILGVSLQTIKAFNGVRLCKQRRL